MIGGTGHAGPDDRNVKAQEGEYVINAQATKQNQGLLQGINSGQAAPVILENAGKLPEQIGIEMKKVMDIEIKKLEDKLEETKGKDGGVGDGLIKTLIDQGTKHLTENANWDQIGKDLRESKMGQVAQKGLDWAGDTGLGKSAKGAFNKVKDWWGGDTEDSKDSTAAPSGKGKHEKQWEKDYGMEKEEVKPDPSIIPEAPKSEPVYGEDVIPGTQPLTAEQKEKYGTKKPKSTVYGED